MKAFVSYSHQDGQFLDSDLLPALESVEVASWSDRNIVPGDNWITSVMEQIQKGDWLVILFTASYEDSVKGRAGPCYRELEWMVDAMTTSRSPGRLIVIWRAGQLPDLLKSYHAIDLRLDTGQLKPMLRLAAEKDRLPRKDPHPSNDAPEPVLRPEVKDRRDLVDLARYNFDKNASHYAGAIFAGQSMQSSNAESLLRLLAKYFDRPIPKPGSWLDVGCGPGLVAWVAEERSRMHQCTWLKRCAKRIGMDYAPSFIWQMPPWIKRCYTDVFEGDLRTLTPDFLYTKTGVAQVELLFANNVFHWLFTEEAIDRAFKTCHQILRPGGSMAVSIAGLGTGSYFLKAYQSEVSEALDPIDSDRWHSHLLNPIGLQSLDEIVRIARRNGFSIEPAYAQLVYEPVRYSSGTDEYVEDARSYGEEVFMAPLLNKNQSEREEIWQRVKQRFHQTYSAHFNESFYVHDQYMIYLLARRDD